MKTHLFDETSPWTTIWYRINRLLSCLLFLLLLSPIAFAQAFDVTETQSQTGPSAEHPCITAQEYQQLEIRLAKNRELLHLPFSNGTGKSAQAVLLSWPLQPSPKLHDCSYYHISAYMDQNTAAGVYNDYNCGSNTYDSHHGTDISTFPFNFYKMDSDYVQVIAAAAGTILDKHDGEYDRNCGSNTLNANYVVLSHSDGSTTVYFHMKNGSITTKAIGQTVAAGEQIGVVGSSGNASGPHLHFEAWTGSTNATRIDPYAGTCNLLNANSFWANQKTYKETAVVKVSVNATDIVIPACPASEIPNEQSIYPIPFQGVGLAPGYAKFYIFLRDELNGLSGTMKILNPDGSVYLTWTYTSTADAKTKIFGWSKLLPTVIGNYTFTATYNGITCSVPFRVGTPLANISALANSTFQVQVVPNPSKGACSFIVDEGMSATQGQLQIIDLLGKEVYRYHYTTAKFQVQCSLNSGIYFYKLTNGQGKSVSGKMEVE